MSNAFAPIVHRFEASLFPVNAYLVEGQHGIVAVDATLGVTDGRSLRTRADALGKPLVAVIVTHAHPDHYGAVSALLEGLDVPVFSTQGVASVIARDDAIKETILRPMFGAEWAEHRTFPTSFIGDGESIELGGVRFRVVDLGPGESPHDSIWLLESDAGVSGAFTGDLAYGHMHGYLADGEHASWLANIERARGLLGEDVTMYLGHGEPGPAGPLLDWQARYIRTFLAAVRSASTARPGEAVPDEATVTGRVTEAMKRFLPSEDLLFLMQLSVPVIARH